MKYNCIAAGVLCVFASAAVLDAQQELQIVGSMARNAAAAARAGALARAAAPQLPSNSASIIGFAWTTEDQALPDATLRLRNVLTGRIEATTAANARGEFTFQNVEGGAYVIELVDAAGRVLAVGSQFSISPGETVATFVRLMPPPPVFTGFFGNAAAAAMSSAAGIGLTAVAATEPVSPPE